MAFLCPSRRGRQKKKHKEPKPPFLGRITGSSSVDTLVRVGLEKQHGLTPEARVCVTQDFLATTPGELSARQGDHVYRLYEEGDWIYVITELGQEGFIPAICLESVGNDVTKKGSNKTHDVTSRNKSHDNPGFERTTSLDGGSNPKQHHHSSPSSSKNQSQSSSTAAASYNVRNAEREREKGLKFNTSMLADEGSDISSSHSPVSIRHQINPLPKPARSHSIPDVVSTTSDSVHNLDNKQTANLSDKRLGHSLNSSTSTNRNSKSFDNNSPKHHHDRYDNSNKLYHDRTRQSQSGGSTNNTSTTSNILELPLMKAGARDSHTSNGDSITEVKTFVKKSGRKIVVVFPFHALEENDLKVQKGEVVTVLNDKDTDWVWVKTKNGNEGFVPKSFTTSIPDDLVKTDDQFESKSKAGLSTNQHSKATKPRPTNFHDVQELRTLRDFEAQSTDDISVKCGEQVFADLANQIEEEWLWVYAPANQSYGYIPKDNVRWQSGNSKPLTQASRAAMGNVNNIDMYVGKPV